MKKSRFSEQQIISVLKQADAGIKVQDICRQHGISAATYYKWKSKYGGMEASDIKRLREVETENSKLKRMFADLALENRALKDLIEKKLWRRMSGEPRRRTLWNVMVWPSPAPVSPSASAAPSGTSGQVAVTIRMRR